MKQFTRRGFSLLLAASMIWTAAALPAEAKRFPVMEPDWNDTYWDDAYWDDDSYDMDWEDQEDLERLYPSRDDSSVIEDEEGEDFHEEIVEPLVLKTKKLTVTVGKRARIITTGGQDVQLRYSSANKRIATVTSKGIVKGKRAGKTKITIRTDDGRVATTVVTVKAVKKVRKTKPAVETDKKTSQKPSRGNSSGTAGSVPKKDNGTVKEPDPAGDSDSANDADSTEDNGSTEDSGNPSINGGILDAGAVTVGTESATVSSATAVDET